MQCKVGDCSDPAKTRGMCGKHYSRWRRRGNPETTVRDYSVRPSTCQAEEDCDGKVVSRGFCSKHYTRWRKYQDTSVAAPPGRAVVDPQVRFEAKVLKDPVMGCWLWTGAKNGNGWPVFSVDGKVVMAHRFAYGTYIDDIPEGFSIKRSCGREDCVAPEHLTATSNDPGDRFWERVKKLPMEGETYGCWEWQPKGFVFRVDGKPESPRRFAWALTHGEAGEALYSLCGNSRCVRPDHSGGVRAKFWTKVSKDPDGCWRWTGATLHGYPHATYQNQSVYAHRLTFEWAGGVFREGFVLTHNCGTTECVNPDHLEQITYQEMVDRRDTKMGKSKDKGTKNDKKVASKSLKEKRAAKQAKRGNSAE